MKPNGAVIVSSPKIVAFATAKNWVWKVAGYRLYCLDGASKVASAEWIDADDDTIAIDIARERNSDHACEVWQGRRLVARLDFRNSRAGSV